MPSTFPDPLYGPYGSAALAYVDRLPAAGANACWFHGFDPRAFDVCASHNLAACVEFPTFRADFAARPELVPVGVDGRPIRWREPVQGVCLSQRDFLDEVEESLLSGLAAYRPQGIWLDYLTYTGWFETPTPDLQESCFCAGCIADFCDTTGIDAATPAEILRVAAAQWTKHKCRRVARFAAYYSGLIRSRLPGCVIGIYMCPWTPAEFDGALRRIFAQDYDVLAPHVDVFTPLIYATKSGRTADWARTFLEEAQAFVPAHRRLQLILDVLEFPDSLWSAAASTRPSWGIQVFGGAGIFADPAQAEEFAAAVAQMQQNWQAFTASNHDKDSSA
jgi:hypothetical protein